MARICMELSAVSIKADTPEDFFGKLKSLQESGKNIKSVIGYAVICEELS